MLGGIPLEDARELILRRVDEIWFRARSMYLCAGLERLLSGWRFSSTLGSELEPARGGANRVAFGAQMDEQLQMWAAQNGLHLAMPSIELSRRLGDKLLLPEIAATAGVATPQSIRVQAAGSGSIVDTAMLLEQLNANHAVVQLPYNDLAGAGTRYIDDAAELKACLTEWANHDVKVAQYVSGLRLTASGIVIGANVAVSGFAYQLVGHDRLTPLWGAHCGNQLVNDENLPRDTVRRCYETVRRLGITLANDGFSGMFGVDLVVTNEEAFVIEINPRIQAVNSLLNAVELAGGMMPAPGVHLLSFLADSDLEVAEFAPPALPYGQLMICAPTAGVVRTVPVGGRWVLNQDAARRSGAHCALDELAGDEALVWPTIATGMQVAAAARLYVLQLPGPAILPCGQALTDLAQRWLDALEMYTGIE